LVLSVSQSFYAFLNIHEARIKLTRDYEGLYAVYSSIFQRDNFTCQVCGTKGIDNAQEWEKTRIDFLSGITSHPEKHQEQLVSRTAHELEELRYSSQATGLMVHHLNGDKTDQRPENLVAVCYSCHRRLHPRGKILSIDEVKQKLTEGDS
jgi:hypothetical protein